MVLVRIVMTDSRVRPGLYRPASRGVVIENSFEGRFAVGWLDRPRARRRDSLRRSVRKAEFVRCIIIRNSKSGSGSSKTSFNLRITGCVVVVPVQEILYASLHGRSRADGTPGNRRARSARDAFHAT